ncbi:MAG: hypothetical protein WA982_06755 [Rubrobacteraceae bacterium]
MANLTITVDEQVLKKARMRALEEDTSVNALLRDYLEDYAGLRQERLEAGRRILEMSRNSRMGSGGKGLPKREELYDREICRNRSQKTQ